MGPVVSSWRANGAEVGASWTFWGEVGQQISLKKTISNKTRELQKGETCKI